MPLVAPVGLVATPTRRSRSIE